MPEDEQSAPGRRAPTRPPDLAHAVGHPTRRAILRTLIETDEAMTLAELDEMVPSANLSTLKYHVLVLRREDCVSQAGEAPPADNALATYVATVSENHFVHGSLEATRREDELR